MSIYYVYSYRDPLCEEPFYIGKGSGDRKFRHLKETTENYLKWCKIKSILNRGHTPLIEILEEFDNEKTAYEFEANLIQKYGRIGIDANGCLTNRCIDGRPPTYAASMPRSEQYKKNMSLAKMGDKNPMYGVAPWNKGHTGYSTSKKGQARKWITDGVSDKQVLRTDPIPEGWHIGRTRGAKGSRRSHNS